MSFNKWTREIPQHAGTLATCMAFAGGLGGALVVLSFVSPMLLALLLLGEVVVFYAFYLRYRRRHR